MKKADFFWETEGQLQCMLCPHHCKLSDGEIGICGVRMNKRGVLYSLVYEKAVATHIDPIEKKPLFHVKPGSSSFSVATVGCNFKCKFCQNCDISQMPSQRDELIVGQDYSAKEVVDTAKRHLCKTIAFTYTEPTIYYEYAFEIASLAVEKGMGTVWISNGYINKAPLEKIAPFLTAANIDLKGWDPDFYKSVVGGELKHVLNTLKLLKKLGVWVEVTTLIVPTFVDNEESIIEIARFIRDELGPETPWHISRFHPQYLLRDLPITPLSIMRRAREIGLSEGLRYVYSGNVAGDVGENTYCCHCGELLIERWGFTIIENRLNAGKCPKCSTEIDGIGL